MRYLGLDVGKKKIGLAVGEALASELTTLRAEKNESFYDSPARERAYEQLDRIMNEEAVDALVVGLPVDEEEQETEESQRIRDFARGLEGATDKQIHFVNETLTSFMARDILESQGVTPEQIEQRIDQVSASLILQQYLEEHALA